MDILKFDCIDSTNTYGVTHFDELHDRTAISASEQTKGKGRFNRVWISKNLENIYLSLILKPKNTTHAVNLTQYLSTVVSKVLDIYGVEPEIKWPNDVLISNKKICGILSEGVLEKNKLKGVVLGVGINLNMDKQTVQNIDRPATSLNLEINKPVDKEKFLNTLLKTFFDNYDKAVSQGFASFKEDYMRYVNFLGKQIYIQQRDGSEKIKYTAKTIDNNGNLIVFDTTNSEKIIFSGDLIY